MVDLLVTIMSMMMTILMVVMMTIEGMRKGTLLDSQGFDATLFHVKHYCKDIQLENILVCKGKSPKVGWPFRDYFLYQI